MNRDQFFSKYSRVNIEQQELKRKWRAMREQEEYQRMTEMRVRSMEVGGKATSANRISHTSSSCKLQRRRYKLESPETCVGYMPII
jgi:hypothetical protein